MSQQANQTIPSLEQLAGKRLHFVGIGGCSMSGLAQICASQGYHITGSDRNESPFTQKLASEGIAVSIGHDASHVAGADLLVFSAAIKPDNPERAEARRLGIPEMERSVLLGQLSRHYPQVVCIAGCHGKTTITSMLALILIEAGIDPTVHIGGMVEFLGSGVRVGESDLFVTEACEYVESYLTLHPSCIVLNNIDDDHLDYFRDIDHIVDSFKSFVSLMPADAPLFVCADDPRVTKLASDLGRKTVSYGLHDADYTASDIRADVDGHTVFTVMHAGKPLFAVALQVPGHHNVLNALAAIVVARHYGAPDDVIARALSQYVLTKRRFEFYGEVDGARIYHDYAHHPSEIRACLQGARSVATGRVFVVFQCNSYTRAKTLFTQNVDCFRDADIVFVPDIYPGREVDTGIVHARDMTAAICAAGTDARYIPTFEEIAVALRETWKPGDMVVTLGSGDVYIQTRKLM